MKNIVSEAVNYTGKTVVVTGAASGAGSGIAKRFAEAGANIAITYNSNKDAAFVKVSEFKALGVDADAFHLDQKNTEECRQVAQAIADRFGTIHCLVNNGGIYPHQSALEMKEEEWDDMLDSNTKGVFFFSQQVAKVMIADKTKGAIVNVSSINAINPCDTLIHYGISKAGVDMMTKCLAHALGPHGIRVNCIAPGLIDAPRLDEFVPGWRESYSERAPLGRIATPEDMGNVCIFLGSDLAGFVTGQTIVVDGGVLLAPAYNNKIG